MPEYLDIDTAKTAPGLRLVLTAMPGAPWTEAAKAIVEVKGIPHVRVRQQTGKTDEALQEWTGIVNAPIAVYDDERPRDGWLEILHLAERLAPSPRLIPADPRERALMIGLANELMGEDGLIWCRRLIMFAEGMKDGGPIAGFAALRGRQYGWSEQAAARAPARVAEILDLFSDQYRRQRLDGNDYLMGESITALDLYWACACAIVAPLAPEHAPMPDVIRSSYGTYPDVIRDALDPALVEHRDRIYRQYLTLPIQA